MVKEKGKHMEGRKKRGREGKREERGQSQKEGKKRRRKRATKMTCVIHNNSMVKSFPQQVLSQMKANDCARLFK